LGNIKKLSALLRYPACGLLSPTWTPGKRVVLQLFPDFEEMDNLRSSAASGVSKTMLIGEPNCFKQSCLQTGRAQLMGMGDKSLLSLILKVYLQGFVAVSSL